MKTRLGDVEKRRHNCSLKSIPILQIPMNKNNNASALSERLFFIVILTQGDALGW